MFAHTRNDSRRPLIDLGLTAGLCLLFSAAPALSQIPIRTAHPVNSQPVTLPPISIAKHPIDAPVRLADASVFEGAYVPLAGHVPDLVARSNKMEAVDPNQQMTITFALRPRNQQGMDALAKRLYDPTDPLFHHFLTPAERIARFSPAQEDFNKVVAFAQRMGLRITDSSEDRQMIQATGTVQQIQNVLGIHLDNYQAPNGRRYYAPDQDPSLPPAIASLVMGIEHLSNADQPVPADQPANPQPLKGFMASNRPALTAGSTKAPQPGGSGFQPADIGQWDGIGIPASEIRWAYGLSFYMNSQYVDGSGQRVALVEFGDYNPSDIAGYINYNINDAYPAIGLSPVPLQTYLVGGIGPGINNNTNECELDIEMLEAVANRLDGIDVYEEPTGNLLAVLRAILADDKDNQVSVSYEFDENTVTQSTEQIYGSVTEELAIQGQAVFVSTGDYGAYGVNRSGLTVNYAAASPWVTGVGGTTLSLTQTNYYDNYAGEVAWNYGNGINGTGGGVSSYFGIPPYQIDLLNFNPSSGASLTNRNVPDVAWDADPTTGVYVYVQGNGTELGGTSIGAPIWAAFWALVNQSRAIYGLSNLGFANPALYTIAGNSAMYQNDFYDITSGNNNYYSAGIGYDNTTGLGSMYGYGLAYDLVHEGAFQPAGTLYASIGPNGAPTGVAGQAVYLNDYLNAPVPQYAMASVSFYQQQGSNQVYLTSVQVTAGGGYAGAKVIAPDVKASTNISYIAEIYYTDTITSKRIGGVYYSNVATVTINPNTLSSLSFNPTSAQAGQAVTGTITLASPAAQNEVIDLTSSDSAHAAVPATITVPAGSTSVTFSVSTVASNTGEQVTITANPDSSSGLGAGSVSGQVTLTATSESITGLTVSPSSVTGGGGGKGTITLAVAETSTQVIHLSSSPGVHVPSTVIVAAGQTSVSFKFSTAPVATNTTATLTATYGTQSVSATLTIKAPVLQGLSITPNPVVGPATATGKVSLTGKTVSSLTYTLSSSNPAVASVPASVTIATGSGSATFPVSVAAVTKTTKVTISVHDPISGITKTKTLTVNP